MNPFRSGRVAVSIRIAAAASGLFINIGTAVTSLILAPIIGSLFLVGLAASVASPDLRSVAYAGVIVTAASGTIASISAMMGSDRRIGVVEEVFTLALFSPVFWVGKVVVAIVASGAVAFVSGLGVFLLDPLRSASALASFLVALPAALVVGAVVGCSIAVVSVTLQDPYLIANVIALVLPLSAGVMAPLSTYPDGLALLSRLLPLTGTVELFRSSAVGRLGDSDWQAALVGELAVATAWILLAVGVRGWVVARLRSGTVTRMTL
jgi:ABC-2 type transport system permease protein